MRAGWCLFLLLLLFAAACRLRLSSELLTFSSPPPPALARTVTLRGRVAARAVRAAGDEGARAGRAPAAARWRAGGAGRAKAATARPGVVRRMGVPAAGCVWSCPGGCQCGQVGSRVWGPGAVGHKSERTRLVKTWTSSIHSRSLSSPPRPRSPLTGVRSRGADDAGGAGGGHGVGWATCVLSTGDVCVTCQVMARSSHSPVSATSSLVPPPRRPLIYAGRVPGRRSASPAPDHSQSRRPPCPARVRPRAR